MATLLWDYQQRGSLQPKREITAEEIHHYIRTKTSFLKMHERSQLEQFVDFYTSNPRAFPLENNNPYIQIVLEAVNAVSSGLPAVVSQKPK